MQKATTAEPAFTPISNEKPWIVRDAPVLPVFHVPVRLITSAVAVHMIIVSTNTSIMPQNAWRTGWFVHGGCMGDRGAPQSHLVTENASGSPVRQYQ